MKKISARTAGICGILSPVIAFASITASILLNPWFRWADHALSDLGALGTSYNFVFNSGLIITGALSLVFLCGLVQHLTRKLSRIGVLLWFASAISLILVGAIPHPIPPHQTVSLSFYGSGILALLTIGVDLLREGSERVWGALILFPTILGLASVALVWTIPYELGAAIPETIGAIVFSEFSIAFGARLRSGPAADIRIERT